MDFMKEIDMEEKIMCPYDPVHYIMRKRMDIHIAKCKKNFPAAKLLDCDFNINHKIPEPELQYHHQHCPDRKSFETVMFYESAAQTNMYPIQNIAPIAEESWDSYNTPNYDPKKYTERTDVLRRMDVASAAVKKNFRIEERHRINELTNNKPVKSKVLPGPSNAGANPAAGRTNELPERPKTTVKENTPNSVAAILMERLDIGKDQVYIPKGKSK